MAKRPMRRDLTQDELKKRIRYEPETGIFTWLPRSPDMFESGKQHADVKCVAWNTKNAGKRAGCLCNDGYVRIRLANKMLLASRIAWLYMTGDWPPQFIDHINRNRADNRFCNLRPATASQNSANVKRFNAFNNASGYRGVYRRTDKLGWYAQISVGMKRIYLGTFATKEDAAKAYREAYKNNFGEFASAIW